MNGFRTYVLTRSIICFLAVCLWGAVLPDTGTAAPYEIGPGDVLILSVWKNQDLSRQITVEPDGAIHIPLAGKLRASGHTVPELEALIRNKLATFIQDPELSISIHQVNSLVVYVTGKVQRPGRFLLHDNLNVLQVLAMAGGVTPFAKSKTIGIHRKETEGPRIYTFNYKAVSTGQQLNQNIRLKRGDVIVVN